MKLLTVSLVAALNAVSAAPLQKRSTVQGFDISHYQGSIDFSGAYSDGARFVIIKVKPTLSSSIRPHASKAPLFPFTPHTYNLANSIPPIGHRRNRLHRPRILRPLRRRDLRELHPGRVPLRAPRLLVGHLASQILRRQRRRMVRRRHHTPRNARHRVQPLGLDLLRPQPVVYGILDLRFRVRVPQPHDAVAHDLLDERLVEYVYRGLWGFLG